MKLLTANLTGKPLDWALAKATGREVAVSCDGDVIVHQANVVWVRFKGHTDPAVCMLLTHKMNIMQQANDGSWRVAAFCVNGKKHKGYGKTLAEAVARCVVQMRLGDEVDVPDELCGEKTK